VGGILTIQRILTTKGLPLVQPAWNANVKFPLTVIFPMSVAVEMGMPDVNRVAIPNKAAPLPAVLVSWLQSDGRFADWF
jgi:hypothetical protein